MAYYKETLHRLKTMAETTRAVSGKGSPALTGKGELDPNAVVMALVQATAVNNASLRTIAIRLAQLAQLYPQRAA